MLLIYGTFISWSTKGNLPWNPNPNPNPRGSIVYVLTRQRSIVIVLIIIVSWATKMSLPAFLRNTKFIHVGELDAIEISETVANVLKKGFSSLHEQLSVPHALFLTSSCAFLRRPPNVEPEKTNFWSKLSQQRKFKRTCVSYYLPSLTLFPNCYNRTDTVKSPCGELLISG